MSKMIPKDNANWSSQNERHWKKQIAELFARELDKAFALYTDPLEVGNHLGEILRSVEIEAVKLVVPRATRKWASEANLSKWEDLIADETRLLELRAIGTSIANTLRPLAGNTFAEWISKVLNKHFDEKSIPLKCVTSGEIKKDLANRLKIARQGESAEKDYRPDIDIVVVNTTNQMPIAILSAKTTLAERVMQTINWKRYKDQLPADVRSIPLFLVTAWETFETGTNRARVQELDGVYVCNSNAAFYGKIKPFSQLATDLAILLSA